MRLDRFRPTIDPELSPKSMDLPGKPGLARPPSLTHADLWAPPALGDRRADRIVATHDAIRPVVDFNKWKAPETEISDTAIGRATIAEWEAITLKRTMAATADDAARETLQKRIETLRETQTNLLGSVPPSPTKAAPITWGEFGRYLLRHRAPESAIAGQITRQVDALNSEIDLVRKALGPAIGGRRINLQARLDTLLGTREGLLAKREISWAEFARQLLNRAPDLRGAGQLRVSATGSRHIPESEDPPPADPFEYEDRDNPVLTPTGGAFTAGGGTKTSWSRIGKSLKGMVTHRDFKSFADAVTEELQVSIRTNELSNITLKELRLFFASKQTGLQMKGSDLIKFVKGAFKTASAMDAVPHPKSIKIVGRANKKTDDESIIVDMISHLKLDGKVRDLARGEKDVFGNENISVVELKADLSFGKELTEVKIGTNVFFLPDAGEELLAYFAEFLRAPFGGLPVSPADIPVFPGAEARPESGTPIVFPKGTPVPRQFFDQINAMLERTQIKTQFILKPKEKIAGSARLKAEEMMNKKDLSMDDIRSLLSAGRIDPDRVVGWMPLFSGSRISSVSKKNLYKKLEMLDGSYKTKVDDAQVATDFMFHDTFRIGNWRVNPDVTMARQVHKEAPGAVVRALRKLYPRIKNVQEKHVPTASGNLHETLMGPGNAPMSTRRTVSLSGLAGGTPGIEPLLSPASYGWEIRGIHKTKLEKTPPNMKDDSEMTLSFRESRTLRTQVDYPSWIFRNIDWAREHGSYVLLPAGGRQSVLQMLHGFDKDASPVQKVALRRFRSAVLPRLQDNHLLPPALYEDIAKFLTVQMRPSGVEAGSRGLSRVPEEQRSSLERWYRDHRWNDAFRELPAPFHRDDS